MAVPQPATPQYAGSHVDVARADLDRQVVDVTPANIAAEAMTLAAGGYYITAFGRVGDNAAVMIGMRAPGASPRTVMIEQGPDLGGYSVVGAMFQTTAPDHIFIDER